MMWLVKCNKCFVHPLMLLCRDVIDYILDPYHYILGFGTLSVGYGLWVVDCGLCVCEQ